MVNSTNIVGSTKSCILCAAESGDVTTDQLMQPLMYTTLNDLKKEFYRFIILCCLILHGKYKQITAYYKYVSKTNISRTLRP